MQQMGRRLSSRMAWSALLLVGLSGGCASHQHVGETFAPPPAPHELARVSLPPYVIEPPDILQIDAIRLVPKPPYRIEPLDSLAIRVTEALPEQPIQGIFPVETDGTVNLGFDYGSVNVQGMSLEKARAAIERHLRRSLKPPYQVTVAVAESRALQQIRGPHLVQPDGTVNLGLYGSVYVDNMTLPHAKEAIQTHLSQFFVNPEISLTISGFNSKVFYVIADGGGLAGDQVTRLPVTGKTTVLDALGQLGGLPVQSSEKRMWLVRPAPSGSHKELILPIDYHGITACGKTDTNYQVLPGDRLYVRAAPLLALDAYIGRLVAPIERVLGTTLLTTGTISSFQTLSRSNGVFGGNGSTGAIITPIP